MRIEERRDEVSPIDRHFVATVFVVENRKLLLIRHRKLEMWLPPGGHINPGELPDEAAAREVLEETGLEVRLLPEEKRTYPLVKMLHKPFVVQLEDIAPRHQHIDLIYLAVPTGGTLCADPEETDGARWFDTDDLGDEAVNPEVCESGRQAIEAVERMRETDIGHNGAAPERR